MIVGIDFGTTNSAIGYFDGVGHLASPDVTNLESKTLRSLLYIDKNHKQTLGLQAAELYLKENTGRPSRLEKRQVGEVELWVSGRVSPINYWHPVYSMVDALEPGRLLESIKTALRSNQYSGTEIFGRFYTIEELISIFLRHLRELGENQFGCDIKSAVIGRPVKYSNDENINKKAENTMMKAAELAGFNEIELLFEPVAAAYDYIQSCETPSTICIFDFGGGTLDVAVLRIEDKRDPQILSTAGIELGGNDLDKRIMTLLYKYFGENSLVDGHPFPHALLAYLQNWRDIPNLYLPENLRAVKRAGISEYSTDPATGRALQSLAANHYGFALYNEIEKTKMKLSDFDSAYLEFSGIDIVIREKISRRDFYKVIEDDLSVISELVDDALAKAGVDYSKIDKVIRTGGSSLAYHVVELLNKKFGAAKVELFSPFTSVVSGLAIYAKNNQKL